MHPLHARGAHVRGAHVRALGCAAPSCVPPAGLHRRVRISNGSCCPQRTAPRFSGESSLGTARAARLIPGAAEVVQAELDAPEASTSGRGPEVSPELAAVRISLGEAAQRLDAVQAQLQTIEELELRLVEEDEVLQELQMLLNDQPTKEDEKALRQQLADMESQLTSTHGALEAAKDALASLPRLEGLQQEVESLRQAEAQLLAQAALDAEALAEAAAQAADQTPGGAAAGGDGDALKARLQQLQQVLQEREAAGQRLATDLEAAQAQLSAAQTAASSARAEAQDAQDALAKKVDELAVVEADVDNMRKMLGKNNKKGKKGMQPGKGGKGFGTPPPPPANGAGPTIGSENSLRQELKQAQDEMEMLTGTLEEREAQLQAAQSAVDFLRSQCNEQEHQFSTLQATIMQLQEELHAREEEAASTEKARKQEMESLAQQLRAETEEKAATIASLKEELDSLCAERDEAMTARETAAAEMERLRAALQVVDSKHSRQDAVVGELDRSLQDLRSEVEAAQHLKVDLAILADAFNAKEDEVEEVNKQLAQATAREAELRAHLEEAEDTMSSLQGVLAELQTDNQELVRRMEQVEANFRRKDDATSKAQGKVTDVENQLVSTSQQVMTLKTELLTKAKTVEDLMQQLQAAQTAEASQRAAAQALSGRLAAEQAASMQRAQQMEQLSEQINMLTEQVSAFSAYEANLRQLQDALRGKDTELSRLKEAMTAQQRSHSEQQAAAAKAAQQELERAQNALAQKEASLVSLRQQQQQATPTIDSLRSQMSIKDAQLAEAQQQVAALRGEVAAVRGQFQMINAELANMRTSRDAAQQEAIQAMRQLQMEMAVEAQSTLELLSKAETLLTSSQDADQDADEAAELLKDALSTEQARSSTLEEKVASLQEELRRRRAGDVSDASGDEGYGDDGEDLPTWRSSWRSGSLEEDGALFKEINSARNRAMAARAEAEALQTRVSFLEQELGDRDRQLAEARLTSAGRGNRQAENLAYQIKMLQVGGNTKLKQTASRQQQLLNQTKMFFQQKINPPTVAAATAGSKASGGSNGA